VLGSEQAISAIARAQPPRGGRRASASAGERDRWRAAERRPRALAGSNAIVVGRDA
jgi:hypothetical protein